MSESGMMKYLSNVRWIYVIARIDNTGTRKVKVVQYKIYWWNFLIIN